MKQAHKLVITLGAILVSPLAQAHNNSLSTGLLAGLAHPLTGLDHLAALILSGILIGRLASSRRLALGGLLCALGLGAAGGYLLGAQAVVEGVILLSLPVFLALQWLRKPAQVKSGVAVMSLFMVAHGWAHGVEMSGMVQGFIPGFLLTSATVTGLSALVSATVRARFSAASAARSHLG